MPLIYRYKPFRDNDANLRQRLRESVVVRRRFGYRLHLRLNREGVEVNWKKLYRFYKKEGLTVRKFGG